MSERLAEEEEQKRRALELDREIPGFDHSSEDDSDEEKTNDFPSNEDFYSSSWSAFHA